MTVITIKATTHTHTRVVGSLLIARHGRSANGGWERRGTDRRNVPDPTTVPQLDPGWEEEEEDPCWNGDPAGRPDRIQRGC